ncbi:hypothetical protein NVP2117O_76 [Vibrio phage 2.117.O._10N.261.45.E9]|nr:hypothetical protein NVP1117O_76 [Vibrio phage 1.117.O._10N.261.45.E9]AUR95477.1 hypothetical protein NVP1207B_70 [Vibrio phage 1.207.B._10N.222.51.C2]AUS02368.1 hypothetical protein NVP2117O_76 [Vibrio phage 2.117.O._10N.261.45.E9]
MACTMGQNKGKRGEREIAKILQTAIDEVYDGLELEGCRPSISRNLNQARSGGFDLAGLPWLAPEVKRQEQLNINGWWKQTTRQAEAAGAEPVLLYKQNHKKWQVVTLVTMPLPDGKRIRLRATLSLDDWLFYFKEQIKRRLNSD